MQIDYQKLNLHLENYWYQARFFYNQNNYPLAAFFSITLIEEIGKTIMLYHNQIAKFRDHHAKYHLAVILNLYVNSRVTKNEKKFASWLKSDELFEIRNRALYATIRKDKILFPKEMISKKEAHLLVCMAGEILAEVQGEYTKTTPNEWHKVLKEIEEFRDESLL